MLLLVRGTLNVLSVPNHFTLMLYKQIYALRAQLVVSHRHQERHLWISV